MGEARKAKIRKAYAREVRRLKWQLDIYILKLRWEKFKLSMRSLAIRLKLQLKQRVTNG
jgi:hypothetical protein